MDAPQTLQQAFSLHRAGRLVEAEAVYRALLRMNPGNVDASYNLGLALAHQGRFGEAAQSFRQAVSLKPDWAAAHESLGGALTEAGEVEAAVASFTQAIRLHPDDAKTCSNLGAALNKLGRYGEAVAACQKAVALNPDFPEAHNNLGNAHYHLNAVEPAIASYRQAIALRPDFVDAHSNLGDALASACRPGEAHAAWQAAHQLRPNLSLLLKMALVLPPIIASQQQLMEDRRRVESAVAALASQPRITASADRIEPPTFYSVYQGFNDRDLQMQIARVLEAAVPDLAWTPPARPTKLPGAGRIRVGFISRFFYSHTIGKVNLGLIQKLARDKFEVVVLKFPGPQDDVSSAIESAADLTITLPLNLEQARRRIEEQHLGVLLYADIGMDPFTYLLAFSRLAPVQCALWGHPVTTGIPTIDYYVSSVHWEPPDADAHYSERLVRLEHLPVYYSPPRTPTGAPSRQDLGLPPHDRLYLCPQSLFKLHPDFDLIVRKILQNDSDGAFVLPQGANPIWTNQLMQRFRREMPEVADRVHFFPRVDHERFLQILQSADVMLDPTPFGGGQTSFDALALGTPIVTMPGQFLRGRLTYAMYRQMEIDDCIAATPEEYARIALRLAADRDWREQVKAKIMTAHPRLFENPAGVRDLEAFLIQALASR